MNDRPRPDELEALRQQNLLLAEENARLKEMLGLEEPKTPLAAPADRGRGKGMRFSARSVVAIVGAGMWIGLSEFFRNQILLAANWSDHYASLGLAFPSAPANAAVWMVWSFVFAAVLFCISRRFTLLQTAALGWVVAFLMMWLVMWNLSVLPLSALLLAVPLSVLESFVASYICLKVAPPTEG